MRIIKESRVKQFIQDHPKARRALERWIRLTRAATWKKFTDVRSTFPNADAVLVASGKKAMVFDINGNDFRLITAVHYMVANIEGAEHLSDFSGGRVYVFYLLTHAQYDREAWKEAL